MALKGVPKSSQHRAKLSAANVGKRHSEATRAKMRASQARRGLRTEQHKERISAALSGKPKSPTARAAMSAAKKGKPGRRLSEAEKLAISKRRQGTVWSAEQRDKLTGRNSPHFGKTPKHWKRRIDYNGILFRSSWEVRVAMALDRRGMKWKYEPQRFDLGECSYLPDFYLTKEGTFLEVKGWFNAASQRKAALFRELYPEYPLVVVTRPVLFLMEV